MTSPRAETEQPNGELARLAASFAGKRILCVGDIMLDRYVYGSVDRVSPEAPIPILRETHEHTMLGAVGNVARNVVALGGEAVVVSVVGDDDSARDIKRLISEQSGLLADLLVVPERKTTIKTRYVAKGQQLLRTDREHSSRLDALQQESLLEGVASEIAHVDALILSDYAKGCLEPALIKRLFDLAIGHGIPVVADPKSVDLSIYNGASVLKPNALELANAFNLPCRNNEEVEQVLRLAKSKLDVSAILVTRSEQGMSVIDDALTITHMREHTPEVVDVSGAGDTASAAIGLALAAGAEVRDAMALANKTCNLVVSKVGTACVYADELAQALHLEMFRSAEAKIQPRGAALDIVKRWREQGASIGFTNGCFDLLHAGHVSLLSQARVQCDRLVVGLNTDASIRRLKGKERPINKESARAVVLASLKDVDLVVFFDEDTPIALIDLFRPDVLIKGRDYTIETVVGSDLVQGYGGRIFLAELAPELSTTRTIERIRSE